MARRHGLGIGITVVAAVLVIAWNVAGEVSASNGVNTFSQNLLRNFPTPPTWIDDATGGKPTIYLGQKITDPQGIWLMEFWNRGLTYVWSLDGTAPPPGRQAPGYVTPDAGPDGLLTGKSIPHGAPPGVDYMVADEDIAVPGKDLVRPQVQSVIKQDEFGFPIHKVVVTPAPWRLLKIDPPLRLASTPIGIEPDGWVTPPFGAHAGRARVQRLQPVLHPGRQAGPDQDHRLARRLAGEGQAGPRDDQGRPPDPRRGQAAGAGEGVAGAALDRAQRARRACSKSPVGAAARASR